MASNLIQEDQLRHIIHKNQPRPVQPNNLLPRNQHSCFGDFPKDSAPKKQQLVVEP